MEKWRYSIVVDCTSDGVFKAEFPSNSLTAEFAEGGFLPKFMDIVADTAVPERIVIERMPT